MVNERKDYISVTILFIVNLINNIDRYTIAGVLPDVQRYYNINDSMAGMIQTVFLISYMIGSPICGYLGDRFNRKYVMTCGMIIWLICVFVSTFIPPHLFPLFLVFRSLVGIGEASYVNICPTIISDMFTSDRRTRVYMLFYLAVPVGSGLGYIISSNIAAATKSWQWGVRVTGIGGLIALAMLLLWVYEPVRGASENANNKQPTKRQSSYLNDLKQLMNCPTYVLTVIGYTTLVFASGTLTWWMPTMIEYSIAWTRNYNSMKELPSSVKNQVGIIFGILTTAAGIAGVLIGNILAQAILYGWFGFKSKRGHLLSAASGAAIAAPCLALLFLWAYRYEALIWVFIGITITGLCFNWSLNVEVYNSVIAPERRSTAFSYATLVSHMFGDASGPYIIGAISDSIQTHHPNTPEWNFKCLSYAGLVTPCMLVLSTIFYFLASLTFVRDSEKLERQLKSRKITIGSIDTEKVFHVNAEFIESKEHL